MNNLMLQCSGVAPRYKRKIRTISDQCRFLASDEHGQLPNKVVYFASKPKAYHLERFYLRGAG